MKEIESAGLALRIDRKNIEIISLLTPEDKGFIGVKPKISLKLILPPIAIILLTLGAQFVNLGSNSRNNIIFISLIYLVIFVLIIYWILSKLFITIFNLFLPKRNLSYLSTEFIGTWLTGTLFFTYLMNFNINGYSVYEFFNNTSIGYYLLIFFILLTPHFFIIVKFIKFKEKKDDFRIILLTYLINLIFSYLVGIFFIRDFVDLNSAKTILILPLIYTFIYSVISNSMFSYIVFSEYRISKIIKENNRKIKENITELTESQSGLSEEKIVELASELNNGIKNLGLYKKTDFYEDNENEIHYFYTKLLELISKNSRNDKLQKITSNSFFDYLDRIYVNDIKYDKRRLLVLNDFKKFSKKHQKNQGIQLQYLKAISHTLSKLRYSNDKFGNRDSNEELSDINKIQKDLINDAKEVFKNYSKDEDFQNVISKCYDLILKRNLYNHNIESKYLIELQNLSKSNINNYRLHLELGYITAFQVFNLRRLIRFGKYDEDFNLFFNLIFGIVKDLILYSSTSEYSTLGLKGSILKILSIVLPYIEKTNLSNEDQKKILQKSITISQEMYETNKNPYGIQILYSLYSQIAYESIKAKNWSKTKTFFSKANDYWISNQKFLSKGIYKMTKAKIEQIDFLIHVPDNSIKKLKKISKFYKEAHKDFKENPLFQNHMIYQALIHDCYCSILQAINSGRRYYIKKAKKFAENALILRGENKLSDFLKKTINALDAGLKGSKGSNFYATYLSKAEKEIKKAIEILPSFEYMPILTAITESVGGMTSDYIKRAASKEGPIRRINKRKIIFLMLTEIILAIVSVLSDLIANKIANFDLIKLNDVPYVVIIGLMLGLIVLLVPIKDK